MSALRGSIKTLDSTSAIPSSTDLRTNPTTNHKPDLRVEIRSPLLKDFILMMVMSSFLLVSQNIVVILVNLEKPSISGFEKTNPFAG